MQIFLMEDLNVNECVTENEDGTYTILVNANLCQDKRLAAVAHALEHIEENDFEKSDVQQIEAAAHKEVSRYGDSQKAAIRILAGSGV